MKKMRLILFMAMLLGLINLYAEEPKKESSVTVYGFVRNEMYFDSYKGINSASDLFYLVPNYDGKVDANGKAINEQLSYNLSAMATRFGLKIAGPEILGAKTTANIEGDFAGNLTDNTALFRVRQANCVLNWGKTSLLVGQTWHPYWGGKVYPTSAGLNTGAPFQPFNRSPQIRLDYKTGNLTLTGALISEFQYKSVAANPDKPAESLKTDQFARNSAIPEIYAGTEFNKGGLTIGLGASYKAIKPSLTMDMDDTLGIKRTYNCNTLLHSFVGFGYVQYSQGKFLIRAKSVLGQNTSYLTMPGGFAISSRNKNGVPSVEYTNYNNTTTFVNALYGTKWQAGLFLGYQKNLGTTKAVLNEQSVYGLLPKIVYGLLPQIQSMSRIAPSISLNVSKLRVIAEYEKTIAEFGTGGFRTSDGLYDQTVSATNHRVIVTMTYFF